MYMRAGNSNRVDARDTHGNTLLHIAAREGHDKIVQYLIKKGATVNARNASKWTPLHSAASRRGNARVVESLITNKAHVNVQTATETTPLHFAVNQGCTPVVKLLLQARANPNLRDERSQTPLHEAALTGNVAIIRLLLEHGANPNLHDIDHQTPLHLLSRVHPYTTSIQNSVNVLVRHGARVNARNVYNRTPLHNAARRGRGNVITRLIAHGANTSLKNTTGRVPYNTMSKSLSPNVASLLRVSKHQNMKFPLYTETNGTNVVNRFDTYDPVTLNHVPLNKAYTVIGNHTKKGKPVIRHVYHLDSLERALNQGKTPYARTPFFNGDIVALNRVLSPNDKKRYTNAYKRAIQKNSDTM
jgi:ankyrin repeat protein